MTRTYDFRGKECPEGYILVSRIVAKMLPGEEVEVIMDSWRCATLIAYDFMKLSSIKMNFVKLGQKDIKFTFFKKHR
ncbi:MAG: hypothetical protein F7B61_02830 [Caldisphaeraceae archaeon]|nr:hypothetical protein [Caldisphaeraceae archaeon]